MSVAFGFRSSLELRALSFYIFFFIMKEIGPKYLFWAFGLSFAIYNVCIRLISCSRHAWIWWEMDLWGAPGSLIKEMKWGRWKCNVETVKNGEHVWPWIQIERKRTCKPLGFHYMRQLFDKYLEEKRCCVYCFDLTQELDLLQGSKCPVLLSVVANFS